MFDTCSTQEQFNNLLEELRGEGFFDTLSSLPILDDEVHAFAGQSARYVGWIRNNDKWEIPMRYKVSVNKMLHNDELRSIMWPAFDLTPSDLNNKNRHISEMLKEIAELPLPSTALHPTKSTDHVLSNDTEKHKAVPNLTRAVFSQPTSHFEINTMTQPGLPNVIPLDVPQLKEGKEISPAKSTSSFDSNSTIVRKPAECAGPQGDGIDRPNMPTIMPQSPKAHSAVNGPSSAMPVAQASNEFILKQHTVDHSSGSRQPQAINQSSSLLHPQDAHNGEASAMTRPIMPLRLKQRIAPPQNNVSTTLSPALTELWSTLQDILRNICEQKPSYRTVSLSAVNCMRDIIVQYPMPSAFINERTEGWAKAMKQETVDIAHEMLVSQDWQGTPSDAGLAAQKIVEDIKEAMPRYIACYHTLLADAALKLPLEKVGGILRFISLPESIVEEYMFNFVHYKIVARLSIMDGSPAKIALSRLDTIHKGDMIPLLLLDAVQYDEATTYGIDALNRAFDNLEDELFATVFDPSVALPKDRVETAIQALRFSRSKYSVYLRTVATNALVTFYGTPSGRSTNPVKNTTTPANRTLAPKKSAMALPRQAATATLHQAVTPTNSTTSALSTRANNLRQSTSKTELSGRTSPAKQALRSRASWIIQQPLRPASSTPAYQSAASPLPSAIPLSSTATPIPATTSIAAAAATATAPNGIPGIIRAQGPPFSPRKRTVFGHSITGMAKSVKDKVSGVLNRGRKEEGEEAPNVMKKKKSVAFGRGV